VAQLPGLSAPEETLFATAAAAATAAREINKSNSNKKGLPLAAKLFHALRVHIHV